MDTTASGTTFAASQVIAPRTEATTSTISLDGRKIRTLVSRSHDGNSIARWRVGRGTPRPTAID
ncbi:hypothetical protein AB0L44_44905 [Nonomuraea wenchangensis]|uniref:hypothetical protein n=1 Tax=Nonomuraea wenchangensis TaxID=568860 RepID=UPI00343660BF